MSTDAENCPACKAGKLCLRHGAGVYLSGPGGHRRAPSGDDPTSDAADGPTAALASPEGPLDPDQVKCPRCYAEAGKPCRTPAGSRAQKLHAARRLATRPDDEQTPKRSPHGHSFTSEQATEAAKKAAQSRRRRKSELEAEAERLRVELEREKLEQEAARLARDASRYADQRAKLKARVLDVAVVAFEATHEALTHQRVIKMDADGRPVMIPKEVTEIDRDGNIETKIVDVPDVRGYATAKDAASLMAAAAAALDKVRLEEDKPTGIHRNESRELDPLSAKLADELGHEGVEKLIATARMLDGMPDPEGPAT
jgi:hypothetical protein